ALMAATDSTPVYDSFARTRPDAWRLCPGRWRLEQNMQNGRTVHIVNDDATARRSLANVLGEAGFGAATYDSADALLAVAPELFGGCALVQVRMPAMDGFAIQSQLHDMKIHLPVVIIAAHGDVATAVRAMKAGAVDVVETPYSHEALVSTIETAFE